MKNKIITISLISILLSSCANGLTGDKKTRHPGNRISVLDLNTKLHAHKFNEKVQIVLPSEKLNNDWRVSDVNQNILNIENISLKNDIKFSHKFRIKASSNNKKYISPIIFQDKLIVNNNANIIAYDLHGKELWRAPLQSYEDKNDIYGGGMCAENGVIYASYGYKKLVAISAEDGKILWEKDLPNIFRSAPVISKNIVYAITVNNQLYALNAKDGNVMWRHADSSVQLSSIRDSIPVVSDNVVLAPYSTGQVYILNAYNGQELTQLEIGDFQTHNHNVVIKDIDVTPIISNGKLYIVNNEGMLVAIDYLNGENLWKINVAKYRHIWSAGNMIYMAANSGEIISIIKELGEVKWESKIKLDKNAQINNIMIAGSNLVASTNNGKFYQVNPKSGEEVSTKNISSSLVMNPLIVKEKIFFIEKTGSNIQVWQ